MDRHDTQVGIVDDSPRAAGEDEPQTIDPIFHNQTEAARGRGGVVSEVKRWIDAHVRVTRKVQHELTHSDLGPRGFPSRTVLIDAQIEDRPRSRRRHARGRNNVPWVAFGRATPAERHPRTPVQEPRVDEDRPAEVRSEEHTYELASRPHLEGRLRRERKNT